MPVDTGVSVAKDIGSNTPACIEMLCGPEVRSCNVVSLRSFRALLRYCGMQPAVNVELSTSVLKTAHLMKSNQNCEKR